MPGVVSPPDWLAQAPDPFGPAPLVLLLGALVLDACAGEPRWLPGRLPGPATMVAAVVGRLEPRLNRPRRPPLDRLVRGVLLVLFLALAAALLGAAAAWVARRVPFGWGLELALVFGLVAARGPWDRARRLTAGAAVEPGAALWPFAPPEPGKSLSRPAILRGLAVALVEGLAGVAFWYLLAGLPGLAAYRAITLCAHLLEKPAPRYAQFGLAARRISETLSLLPAVLVGAALCPAAVFVPGGRPRGVIAGLAGWGSGPGNRAHLIAAAAFSGGLGLVPSGRGEPVAETEADLRRGLYLCVVVWLIGIAALAGLAMVRFSG